jgi:hypothetical protein
MVQILNDYGSKSEPFKTNFTPRLFKWAKNPRTKSPTIGTPNTTNAIKANNKSPSNFIKTPWERTAPALRLEASLNSTPPPSREKRSAY